MAEIEQMLGTQAIHSNGIKRCFGALSRSRSAYRDLKCEVAELTSDYIDLDELLRQYHRTWVFYREHLYRRANPEAVVTEMLHYCYPRSARAKMSARKRETYQLILDKELNVPMLVLMLLRVLPGYDSKEGDVVDIERDFFRVQSFFEQFTSGGAIFEMLPAVKAAREYGDKSRLMLIDYVQHVLDVYQDFIGPESMRRKAVEMQEKMFDLDISGVWVEGDGHTVSTNFWVIEAPGLTGNYFATFYSKKADNTLVSTFYTLFVYKENEDVWGYYWVHPIFIKHLVRGVPAGDNDCAWYFSDPTDLRPDELRMDRAMDSNSPHWPLERHLTRCTDPALLAQYEHWMNDCKEVNDKDSFRYEFYTLIYAVTQTHLYIGPDEEGIMYKVPKSSYDGFAQMNMQSKVGLLYVEDKIYLAFDDILLYIPITKKNLENYHIERIPVDELNL
ncbi:MAG: hypothetical protein K6E86_07000 [Bacteroidales bacterium]|nr:hypothetical protein [Bacteroidales bacterium]